MLAYLQTGWYYVWQILRPKKKLGWQSFVVLGVIILAAILITSPIAGAADASWTDSVVNFISSIILWIATLFLKLSIFLLTFIIEIAGYNGYLDAAAVNYGWVMIRDLTNMFFVVILLLIAFGTILGIEQYEWKKLLVKFVAAAILVNFSRIICGAIIDVGQVIMITFINGVAATAGGNLINAFGVDQILTLAEGENFTSGATFLAAVGAVAFASMIFMTMLVYIVILIARMIELWILIVMSPLAFVLSVIPNTQKYASEWWQKFGSNVVAGPVIAFFLWLSFATLGGGNINDDISAHSAIPQAQKDSFSQGGGSIGGKAQEQSAGITKAMTWSRMANFAIAIGMLLAGAKAAQQLGVTGGGMMSKVGDFSKKVATIASGVALGQWIAGKGKQGGMALGKGALMNVPLVGGHAWQRRGAGIKNLALRGGTKWNEAVGARLGAWAQFAGHEKIMKERKAQAEQLAANLSSSAKGKQKTLVRGKQLEGIVGIEAVRAYTDVIQGQGKVMKEKSEAKRGIRRDVASAEKLIDQAGNLTKAGEDYMKQMAGARNAAMNLSTVKVKVDIESLTGGMGAKTIETMGEKDEAEALYTNERRRMLSQWKTGKSEEAYIEGKEVTDKVGAFNNNPANNSSQNLVMQQEIEKLNAFKKGLREAVPAGTTNETFAGEMQGTFNAGLDNLIKMAPAEMQAKLAEQLGSVENPAQIEAVLADVESEINSRQGSLSGGRNITLDPTKADEQIKLLQALLDAQEKGTKIDMSKFDRTLVKDTIGREPEDVNDDYLKRLQTKQAQEGLAVLKSAQHHAADPVVAAARSKVLGDDQARFEALRHSLVEEDASNRYLNKRRGLSVPSDAGNKAIAGFQDRYKGLDRVQLLSGLKNFSKLMTSQMQKEGYKGSEDYKKDLYHMYGLLKQLHETRFQDDPQGLVEGHIKEAIDGVGDGSIKKQMQDFADGLKNMPRGGTSSGGSGGRSGTGVDLNAIVGNSLRSEAMRGILQQLKISENLKGNLERRTIDDLKRTVRQLPQYLLNNAEVTTEQLHDMIESLGGDIAREFRENITKIEGS